MKVFWGKEHQIKYASKELPKIKRKTSKDTVVDLPKPFFDKDSLEILDEKLRLKIVNLETGTSYVKWRDYMADFGNIRIIEPKFFEMQYSPLIEVAENEKGIY